MAVTTDALCNTYLVGYLIATAIVIGNQQHSAGITYLNCSTDEWITCERIQINSAVTVSLFR